MQSRPVLFIIKLNDEGGGLVSHHYKRYSKAELQAEEDILQKKLHEAETAGQRNYAAVHRRKIEIVRSYMLDRTVFSAGDIWQLKEDPDHYFKIDEMSGVIAWGYLVDRENEGIDGER